MIGVFGPRSTEMSRYSEYAEKWKSGSKTEREDYLESLRADLISGLERLEANSSQRWIKIGFGVVENEKHRPVNIVEALGLPDIQTGFIRHLERLCDRLEIALQFDCPDAAAFYLRKILEVTITSRCEADQNQSYIDADGKIKGLEVLLKLVQKEGAGKGYVTKKVVARLLDHKILWDRSVHSLSYEPSRDTLVRAIEFIRQALAEMKIEELR